MRLPSNLRELRAAWRATADVPANAAPCFSVSNATSGPAKVYLNGLIGGLDSDAGDFVRELHALNADAIDLHINSPGGFVFDAVSMFEALRDHSATVNVRIDGLAASAASFLAMAGDTVEIAKGGRMMIHDAQGVGIGSPAELREYADLLDSVSDDIAGYYAGRAGGTPASWRTAMSATTWYSAQQAVGAKLADRVTGGKPKNGGPDNRTRLIRARAAITLKG